MDGVGIISASFALQSLRNSGYKSTALAVAELVDNSIDAGATNVDVINLSEEEINQGNRQSYQKVKSIGILDNGSGMDLNTLHRCLSLGWGTKLEEESGLGKYGFGLKGASLATCKKVSVYTWQKPDQVFKVHIDLDEIKEKSLTNIDDPVTAKIPEQIKTEFGDKIKNSGTLVLWEKLDKIDFAMGRTLVNRLQKDFCRIYRHFLDDDDSYGKKRNIKVHILESSGKKRSFSLKANDPLYQLTPNNIGALHENESTNEIFENIDLDVEYIGNNGEKKISRVVIRSSIAKPEIQALGGSSDVGRHYANNTGISFVREGREIELAEFGFLDRSEPRHRWWGMEVRFQPELDDLFGVTTNKQHVRNIRSISSEEAPELNESVGEDQFKNRLILDLNHHIKELKSKMLKQITVRAKGSRSENTGIDEVEEKVNKKIDKDKPTESKKVDSEISSEERKKQEDKMKVLLKKNYPTNSDDEVKKMVNDFKKMSVTLKQDDWPGSLFIDRQSINGCAVGVINTNTEFFKKFFDVLDKMDDSRPVDALRILILAYIRAEDEMSISHQLDRQTLEQFRSVWSNHLQALIPIAHES